MPSVDQFLRESPGEPAQASHRWAQHNDSDIDISFGAPQIWLLASATGRTHGAEHDPILILGSKDLETVSSKAKHRRNFDDKTCPRHRVIPQSRSGFCTPYAVRLIFSIIIALAMTYSRKGETACDHPSRAPLP